MCAHQDRPRRLLTRILVVSILVAACSVAATAWLASRITTGAIQQERGDALSTDARVYEALLGYAATHSNWAGVTSTVARLATQTGNRITVTTENRHIIATSTGRPQTLPQAASEVVDPLDVDPVLVPDTSTDRVDPRAVGPFALTDAERGYLDELAQRMLICIGRRDGGGSLTFTPSGRPHVTGPNPTVDSTCELSELDYPTATEATALQQLDSLVGACLSRERRPVVRLNLDLTWTRATPSNPDDDQAVQACIDTARREQLSPYVAPAALLFISAPTATASGGLDLSPQNQARIAGVAALILLLAIAVTALAGMWLVRPLRTLTAAARNMTDGEYAGPVRVRGHDEIGQLATAFNEMADGRARAERQRTTMVSDVAHELRTPLSNIRGWLEALQDGLTSPDEAVIGSVLDEALLLQHIVDDLQDLALIDAGTLRLHPEPVRLADVLVQVVSAHQATAERVGVDLTADCDDVELTADPLRLRQAVGNLVTNAVRHTPEGGRVTVSGRRSGGLVLIEVRDTGAGMSADDLRHVFDRFWRAEKSRSRQTGGTGLGLSIVRKLMEAHGGTADAASRPGEGSAFTLTLPG